MRFPGVDAALRALARVWFQAEYSSLWAPKPIVTAPAPEPAPRVTPRAPAHPQEQGATFMAFMANLSHLQDPFEATESSSEDELESEAAKYLDLPEVPMETDILVWWAANEAEFPNLSVMARQYLGVPATSASAERLFSIAGRVYDDLRQGMAPEMLEERMWAIINCEGRKGV